METARLSWMNQENLLIHFIFRLCDLCNPVFSLSWWWPWSVSSMSFMLTPRPLSIRFPVISDRRVEVTFHVGSSHLDIDIDEFLAIFKSTSAGILARSSLIDSIDSNFWYLRTSMKQVKKTHSSHCNRMWYNASMMAHANNQKAFRTASHFR